MNSAQARAFVVSSDWESYFRTNSELQLAKRGAHLEVTHSNADGDGHAGRIVAFLRDRQTPGSAWRVTLAASDHPLQKTTGACKSYCTCELPRCIHAMHLVRHEREKAAAEPVSEKGGAHDKVLAWAKSMARVPAEKSTDSPWTLRVVVRVGPTKTFPKHSFHVQPLLMVQHPNQPRPVRVESVGHDQALNRLSPDEFTDYAALSVHPMHSNLPVGSFFVLRSEAQDLALERVIRRGNAVVEKANGKRLSLMEAVAPELSWEFDGDGVQRLVMSAHGRRIVQPVLGSGVWHFDEATNTIGRLLINQQQLRMILTAPALPPELSAATVAKWPSAKRVPRPVDASQIEDVEVEPTARVNVAEQDHPSDGAARPVATVRFDYAGHQLPPALEGDAEAVVVRTAHGLKRIRRNRSVELETMSRLGDRGLDATDDPSRPGALRARGVDDVAGFLNTIEAVRGEFAVEAASDFGVRALPEADGVDIDIDADGGNHWFSGSIHITLDGRRQSMVSVVVGALSDPKFSLTPNEHEPPDATWTLRLQDGTLVRIPLARLRTLLAPIAEWLTPETIQGPERDRFRISRLQAAVVAEEIGQARSDLLPDLRAALARVRAQWNAPLPSEPEGFVGELRVYQREGLRWLNALEEGGFGGVLADDMGLGKTPTAIAHVLSLKERGRLALPVMIVATTTLIPNWQQQLGQFAPGLRVLTLHGPARAALFAQIPDHDIVLTTYSLLQRDLAPLSQHRFGLLIADEAQTIKNHLAQAALAIRQIKADRYVPLSGTPVENHLGDLFSQIDLALPTLLGDMKHFRRSYRNPIERHGQSERMDRLNARIRPFVLRRTKDQVATELPPKTEIIRYVDLGHRQRELYESIRVTQHQRVREEIATRGLASSNIIVLTALLKLRQVCCDPALLPTGHKVSVQDSAKLESFTELLGQLLEEGRRVLVFSQFASMLDRLSEKLQSGGVGHVMLTGSTHDRKGAIEAFQSGGVPVFLISLKAGGVGLNLTAADTVIHYDPWWNPSVENQATDRAHRIGQEKPVMVIKMLCRDTVEEKVLALQQSKAELAKAVLDGGTTTGIDFDETTIEALLGGDTGPEKVRSRDRSAAA